MGALTTVDCIHSAATRKQGKEGKSIYKATESTVVEPFALSMGAETDKRALFKYISLDETARKLFILLAPLEVHCILGGGGHSLIKLQNSASALCPPFLLTIEALQVHPPAPLQEEKSCRKRTARAPDSADTEQGEPTGQINKEFAGVCKTKAAAKQIAVGKEQHVALGYVLKKLAGDNINWKSVFEMERQRAARDGEDGGVGLNAKQFYMRGKIFLTMKV